MSLSNFYRIPFEWKVETINDTIKSIGLECIYKGPLKRNIIYESSTWYRWKITFNHNLVIDNDTQTKLGSFTQINQKEYEEVNNTENAISSIIGEN